VKVFALIVAYETEIARLDQVLDSLREQCQFVIVDNSESCARSAEISACAAKHGSIYISMGGNSGIGAALNAGIALAWGRGAEGILLLDDDSIPARDIVETLVTCSESLGQVVVVGANALDSDGFEISNARHISGSFPSCRDMMSSGTLIRREIFELVGPFDESLFIDCVDFDWGWRARSMGIELRLCRATSIVHQLGEGLIAGVRYPSPIRHYFQYRNILRMMIRPYTPWAWRLSQFFKLPVKLVLIPLLMPNKVLRLRFAFAGISDAIRGLSGPWSGANVRSARSSRVI
jgi:rhamnosyltransferase